MIVCVPTVSLHCIYIHTYIYILYLCICFCLLYWEGNLFMGEIPGPSWRNHAPKFPDYWPPSRHRLPSQGTEKSPPGLLYRIRSHA